MPALLDFVGLDELNGREMTYSHCNRLPFLTRCVMETLRLWTAVPNGSFRQLQYEDEIHGPGGNMVLLPKGTFVQVVNWMRHRSRALWGDDADEFNPDRKFEGNEIWGESSTGGEGGFTPTQPVFWAAKPRPPLTPPTEFREASHPAT